MKQAPVLEAGKLLRKASTAQSQGPGKQNAEGPAAELRELVSDGHATV